MNKGTTRESDAALPHLTLFPFSRLFLRLLSGGWSLRIFLVSGDFLAILLSFLSANFIFSTLITTSSQIGIHLHLLLLSSAFIILSIHMQEGYKYLCERRPENVLAFVFKGCLIGFLLTIAISFVLEKRLGYSRYIIIMWFVFSLTYLMIFRFLVRGLLTKFWSSGLMKQRVLMVGKGESLGWIMSHLKTQRHDRFRYIGIVHNGGEDTLPPGYNFPYLGKIEDIYSIIERYHIERVILARDSMDQLTFVSVFDIIRKAGVELNIISPAFLSVNAEFFLDDFTGMFTLRPTVWPLSKLGNKLLKRSMDLIIACAVLPVLLILTAIIGIMVKIEDGGRIFYRRRVLGSNQKEFDAFKFRSMRVDADEILNNNIEMKTEFEKNFKLRNDTRITGIGHFVRKSSLDELPQIFNVLRGEMSIVGPRMIVRQELERYGDFAAERFKVKPGITGYWQVMGRQEVDYEERIKMDNFYIEYWSIWMDIVIIFQTFWKVLKREGAY